MRKLFLLFLIIFIGFLFFISFGEYSIVFSGSPCPSGEICIDNPIRALDFSTLIEDIIDKIIFKIVGPLAVLVIVVAGYYFMFSGGKPESITIAKSMIVYVIVGIIIVASARAIVNIIKTASTGRSNIGAAINQIAADIFLFVGVVGLIFVVIGGFQVLTSGGDPAKVSSGRNRIIYALIGILVAASAWAIVNIVMRVF